MDGACTLRNLVKYLKTFSASYTSIILRWLWHVSRTGERCIAFFLGGGSFRETEILEYLGVDGRIILKWIILCFS